MLVDDDDNAHLPPALCCVALTLDATTAAAPRCGGALVLPLAFFAGAGAGELGKEALQVLARVLIRAQKAAEAVQCGT